MTEDEIKLEQNSKDINRLNKERDEILNRIAHAKEPKWIAAVSRRGGDRLVLNLAGLDECAKNALANGLKRNAEWVSFGNDGSHGQSSYSKTGLNFYPNTKIVF